MSPTPQRSDNPSLPLLQAEEKELGDMDSSIHFKNCLMEHKQFRKTFS
jgi:hypothetical protein